MTVEADANISYESEALTLTDKSIPKMISHDSSVWLNFAQENTIPNI